MVNIYASLVAAGPLHAMHAALTARLKLAFPTTHFGHHTLPARITLPVWQKITRRTPAICLGWNGFDRGKDAGRVLRANAKWSVLGATRNEAGVEPRLLGDALGAGQIGVAQVAAAALHGMAIRDVGTVAVTGATNLVIEGLLDEHAALTGIDITVNFDLRPAPATGDIDEFLTGAADWRLAPLDTAAASDVIPLREDAA